MAELPLVLRILGTPAKLFYEAFRHTQRVVSGEEDAQDDTNPFVGFRISLLIGGMAVVGIFNTLDRRTPFLVILAFTGLSCAWQLRPFWRETKVMSGRVPHPGLANWLLSHHGATSVVLEAVGNAAMALNLANSGFFDQWNGRAILGVVFVLMWVPFNRFVFINLAVLELLKQHVASDLRFAVFRRFQSDSSKSDAGFNERHRQIILPVLGAFGKVSVVHDDSLEKTEHGPNSDSERINADAEKAIKLAQGEWVHGVFEMIRASDVAVFHWGSVLSESMLLELHIAEKLLTSQRLIFVVDGNAGAVLELFKREFSLPMQMLNLQGGYGGFLRQLWGVIREMADTPVHQPKADSEVPKWSGAAWDVLKYCVAHRPNAALPSGCWRLPAILGGSDCEIVMFAGRVMGRGHNEIGWFHILGTYSIEEGVTLLTATQYYVDGDSHSFRGVVRNPTTIAIQMSAQTDGDMIFLSAAPHDRKTC